MIRLQWLASEVKYFLEEFRQITFMRNIPLNGLMVRAWKEGISAYIPDFPGLAVEVSDARTSLNNLTLLVKSGRQVASMQVGLCGVLVLFTTSEAYLATGFSIDPDGPVRYLARFCSLAWGNTAQEWFEWLSSDAFGAGYEGWIDPALLPGRK